MGDFNPVAKYDVQADMARVNASAFSHRGQASGHGIARIDHKTSILQTIGLVF